jgi:hypothetical protein
LIPVQKQKKCSESNSQTPRLAAEERLEDAAWEMGRFNRKDVELRGIEDSASFDSRN